MRHNKKGRSFNRPKAAREALIRHLAHSLILRGRIETTVPKAKEARRLAERVIQFGIRGDLASYRRSVQLLGNDDITSFLFKEVAPLFKTRQGGYTRIFRNRVRPGDGVELAILELVEKRVEPQQKKVKEPVTPRKEEAPPPSVPKSVEKPRKEKVTKETEKKEKTGGFLANLRKFIKPKDRS